MSQRLPAHLRKGLVLPAVVAPMFRVSGPELAMEACRAGLIGSFPAINPRTLDELDRWLAHLGTCAREPGSAAWALNLIVHRTYERAAQELELAVAHRPPLVITSLGSPRSVVDAVHGYGGLVFADVNSVTFARKAAAVGVDGLVLVAAGAGGHTGMLTPFAFVHEVRKFWQKPIVLGGAIGDGWAIRASEALGADLAYLGTRFLACQESRAEPGYKQMVAASGAEDIMPSNYFTGVTGNWLRPSLVAAGFEAPEKLVRTTGADFKGDVHGNVKAWKDVWSAGQGVGAVGAIEPVAAIVERLRRQYWRAADLQIREAAWPRPSATTAATGA
jgi:nitronate monooxygenase